jgi:hypothetical protein
LVPWGTLILKISSQLNLRWSPSKQLCPHLLDGKTLSRTGLYLQSQAGKLGTGGFSQTRVDWPKTGIPSALLNVWIYPWPRPPRMKTSW